jgi:5'-nucleotidase/UDP-sugar diphosphatase
MMVNDVYQFLPNASTGMGGFGTLKALVESQRRTPADLFVLCGDFLGGSHLAEFSKGKVCLDICNTLPLDAVVIGNHEFDYGLDVVIDRVAESKFPWYGGNVVDKRTGQVAKGLKSHSVHTVQLDDEAGTELRVGVFGVVTQSTPFLSYPGPDCEFTDAVEAARTAVAALQEAKVDIVVGLTHLSLQQDRRLASEVPGIDFILGGHDHSPVQLFEGHTFIMKCGQNAEWLGVLDIECVVDATHNTSRWLPSWRCVANVGYAADPAVVDIVAKYHKMDEEAAAHIDKAEVLLKLTGEGALVTRTDHTRFKRVNSGALLANAMIEHYFLNTDLEPQFAVINGGFIRGNTQYKAGSDFTMGMAMVELPFPKPCVLVEMKGADVKEALEQMLRLSPASNAAFPHVSRQLSFDIDVKAPEMQRVSNIKVGKEEFDPNADYRVVTSTFIALGGDGNDVWTRHTKLSEEESELKIRDVFVAHCRHLQTVDVNDC